MHFSRLTGTYTYVLHSGLLITSNLSRQRHLHLWSCCWRWQLEDCLRPSTRHCQAVMDASCRRRWTVFQYRWHLYSESQWTAYAYTNDGLSEDRFPYRTTHQSVHDFHIQRQSDKQDSEYCMRAAKIPLGRHSSNSGHETLWRHNNHHGQITSNS